jgi:purine-cytosine permease-like protein
MQLSLAMAAGATLLAVFGYRHAEGVRRGIAVALMIVSPLIGLWNLFAMM